MTVEKPKRKQLLRPITTGTNSAMNQSQFLAFTRNWLEAREESCVHGSIGFWFCFSFVENLARVSYKPITKCSNRNHVITFDSHLKTAQTSWGRNSYYDLEFHCSYLSVYGLHGLCSNVG